MAKTSKKELTKGKVVEKAKVTGAKAKVGESVAGSGMKAGGKKGKGAGMPPELAGHGNRKVEGHLNPFGHKMDGMSGGKMKGAKGKKKAEKK